LLNLQKHVSYNQLNRCSINYTTMKYIAYYRLSVLKKNQNQYGIEAQTQAVKKFVNNNELVAEYTEYETGTSKRKRVEIFKAIEHCQKIGSDVTLVIAKLDRLSRSVAFTSTLLESGINFVAVDNPHASPMTIQILSVIAEFEAKAIANRVLLGLAIAKQKGVILGKPENLTNKARENSINKRKQLAKENENNIRATSIIKLLRESSKMSFAGIASKLNDENFRTATGKRFLPCTVQMLWDRAQQGEQKLSAL
jgi:DNA invertase Pin-like site-specific DNA recombinase